jgi:hypothetical protein
MGCGFERRMTAHRARWDDELGDYLGEFPTFADVDRRARRHLRPVLNAARPPAS